MHDINEPGSVRGGITSVGCKFCKDQISASKEYTEHYESVNWKKGGCQNAMCRFFQTPECPEVNGTEARHELCPMKGSRA